MYVIYSFLIQAFTIPKNTKLTIVRASITCIIGTLSSKTSAILLRAIKFERKINLIF